MLSKKDRESLELYVYEEHKSAFGTKGRHYDFKSMTDKELHEQARYISDTIIQNHKEEKEREKKAIKKYEASLESIIKLGAENRKTAIKWLLESKDFHKTDDASYICYELGLPYSMESEFKGIER